MSAFDDLARMAEWLDHAQEDAGVPTCNAEECHKCIALRAHAEFAQARAELAPKPAARELLQRLWTKAVGTEGYDKAEWKALERALEGTSAKQKP